MKSASFESSEVAGLIPVYWDLTATTVEDIMFFGKITIREMKRSWRSQANNLSLRIKTVNEWLKLMSGKTAKDIIQIAKQSEDPEFFQIGVRKNDWNWEDDPEPLDAASIIRKDGATTFNVCGWCRYVGGGKRRYNYRFSLISCKIIKDAGISKDRKFNTLCAFKTADDSFFDQIRNGLESTRQRLIKEKRQIDYKIKLLLTLEKRAEKKPAIPSRRPNDWFNENDPVICYVGNWQERIVPDQFVKAKVFRPGKLVSVEYDKRVHNGDYLEGCGSNYGMFRPEVMHVWEFEYLLAHPDFASLWSHKAISEHFGGFDAEKFFGAIAKETTSQKPQCC